MDKPAPDEKKNYFHYLLTDISYIHKLNLF